MEKSWIEFWAPAATAHASAVDLLFAALLASCLFVVSVLFFLLLRFAIHYRAGSHADRSHRIKKSWHWEVSWTAASLLAFLALFVWGARLYLDLYDPPKNAIAIYVVAKQWMWKVQHVGGQREINELHVPLGKAVRLIMASQDVIHSFFIPAFRIKHDVLPGRYQTIWFEPQKEGVFHLFCAEYCGTDHSRMTGRVVVMSPSAFEQWLARQDTDGTLAQRGKRLFSELGCSGCHMGNATVRAPRLEGLFGKPVPLQDGRVVVADEAYIRDSVLNPRAEVASGYAPLMPSFSGKISEDELTSVVAYIKSLADTPVPPP